MDENIHIGLFRESDALSANVWVEVSRAVGQPPVLRRSLNLWTIVKAEDSLADIQNRLKALCALWFQRHVNLPLYCERAQKWTGRTLKGTEIQLTSINAERATWEYFRVQQRKESTLYFNATTMCIDWVCAEGLTGEAQDIIVDAVSSDIERHEAARAPDHLRRQSLVGKFLTLLPPHQDITQDAVVARYPLFRPHT